MEPKHFLGDAWNQVGTATFETLLREFDIDDLSPIHRDGKFVWETINTRAKRDDKGNLVMVPCWLSLFFLPDAGHTQPREWMGSIKEEFTGVHYRWTVRFRGHDDGDSVTASFNGQAYARRLVETFAKLATKEVA